MSQAPITYDLVLLLDPQAEEPARERVLAEAKAAIEAHGELLREDHWGLRPLTYPIARKTEAEYHLIQFHVREASMLADLDRSLRLSDQVLRFMISKLAPGTPEAPSNPDSRARHQPVEPEPDPAPAAA
jgi:small subunit ribosomal protein S6